MEAQKYDTEYPKLLAKANSKSQNTCSYSLEENIILNYDKIWVPSALRTKVLEICHKDTLAGHPGDRASKKLIKRHFNWPAHSCQVDAYIHNFLNWGKKTH